MKKLMTLYQMSYVAALEIIWLSRYQGALGSGAKILLRFHQ